MIICNRFLLQAGGLLLTRHSETLCRTRRTDRTGRTRRTRYSQLRALCQAGLLFLLLFAFGGAGLRAQTYPVQTHVYLAPPYSNFLSDYYSSSKERLVVTLLNRDQQRPTLDVRLRMTVTSANGLKIQSREEINYPAITLDAGVPFRLTQDDLAPYFLPQHILTQGSFLQGKLPDGLVEFTFQAVEKYTGKTVSAPATGRVWLSSQKPPVLRLPSNNEYVAFKDPLNLKFQWEPLHKNLSQVEYEFELKELPGNGVAPESAFLYAPVIYQERLPYTYLMYTVMMPPLDPDRRYAWRVRAIAKDGVDDLNLFDNNGYSEVYSFRTTSLCEAPSDCHADLKDRSLLLNWLPGEGNNEFVVQYRLKNDVQADWKEGRTYETQTSLYDMKRGATYEFRIGAICTSGQPVFTPTGEITVPAVDSARLARCGILGSFDLSNQEPIESLQTGDVVMVNDYPMTLTRVSGGNGSFSGEGWVPVNWLLNTKWAVGFDNIRVNTDRQMIGGSVRALYDESEAQIANIDHITAGGHDNTRQGIIFPDVEFDIVIPENPVFEYNPETGEMTVYTTDGQSVATVQIEKNEGKEVFPLIIKDKEGNLYRIDTEKDGAGEPVTGEGGAPKLVSEPLGKQTAGFSADSFNPNSLTAQTAVVTFEQGSGQYSLDAWKDVYREIVRIREEYDKLADDYYASWKFLPVGGSDKVTAAISIPKGNPAQIDPDKVIFSTPQGMRFDAKPLGDNRYELTLAAGQDKDVQEIYALYPEQGSDSRFLTLGKLNVVTYQQQSNELVVVQVNGTIDGRALENTLNDIYRPVGASWSVRTENFSYTGDLSGFIDKKSGILSAYNEKMNELIATYKASTTVNSKASYLFILDDNGWTGNAKATRDADGFMPRGKQFGFIFTKRLPGDVVNYVIAHELGHGRWRLQHTFDSMYGEKMSMYSTDNLMDYAKDAEDYKKKVKLAKWQWEQLVDPAWFTNPFEGDEKGMAVSSTPEAIQKIVSQLLSMGDKGCAFVRKEVKNLEATPVVELPSQNYSNTNFSYLIGSLENERVAFISPENKISVEEPGFIMPENKEFILYVDNGQVYACEATEDYSAFTNLEQARKDAVFVSLFESDLLKCKNPSKKKFNQIQDAILAKLANEFYTRNGVKLCVELTSADGHKSTLTSSQISSCDDAEVKLRIYVDLETDEVNLSVVCSKDYLKEYQSRWQAKVQEYNEDWETAIDIEAVRLQVIADLEDAATARSFFENLSQRVNALLSDRIADCVEGMLVSQKIVKNIWEEAEINRSTWHSSDNDHSKWPVYAQFHPVAGGVSDGVIGEIAGIPIAIKGIYGIMTDKEQRQALSSVFTKEGMASLWEKFVTDAVEIKNDNERLAHFSSRTTIEIATMLVPATQFNVTGKLGEIVGICTDGIKKYNKIPGLNKKIEDIASLSKAKGVLVRKKVIKDFFDSMDPDLAERLLKIDNFDKTLVEMIQSWKKFHGEKFVFEHLSKQSDDFIASIHKFEGKIDDLTNFTADVILKSGKTLEFKSWAKSSFASLMGKDQFKNQLKNYIKNGDFEYIFNKNKLVKEVANPEAFVRGEFQKVFKANDYELFKDFYSNPKIKEVLFENIPNETLAKRHFIQMVDDHNKLLFNFIKVE